MFIEKIRLKNIKCFTEQTFDFTEQFTILIGDNGNGKTTILDGISIALGTFFKEIDGVSRWQINSESCYTLWCKIGTDCGRCMSVCPYAHPDTFFDPGIKWFVNMVKIKTKNIIKKQIVKYNILK